MTALAAVTGFAVALVLVLGWIVLALRRDVAALTAELMRVHSAPTSAPEPVPQPASAPLPDPPAVGDPPSAPSVRTVVSLDSRQDGDAPVVDEAAPVEDVPVITALADQVDDVDLTTRRVASVTLARPLIKVAALTYGVRRALDDEHRLRVRLTMRRELKRQRKMRRRRRAGRAPSQGWVP
jgi:hypothetical protein